MAKRGVRMKFTKLSISMMSVAMLSGCVLFTPAEWTTDNQDSNSRAGGVLNDNVRVRDVKSNDLDADGVLDVVDRCPHSSSRANVNRYGCESDADEDNVPDYEDSCLGTPSNVTVDAYGCSIGDGDSDGDGVPDRRDRCPNTLPNAVVDENGCALKQAVVLRNVFFDFGSAVLRSESSNELDRVVSSLVNRPTLEIKVTGHTDSIDTEAVNLALSNARALAVKQYLVNAGIEARRIEAEGKGESSPVASNSTSAGRQQNRRVEVDVLAE